MGYNLTQINPAYELVSDIIVSSATTSVDFTGLNIGKEDDYMLVSDYYRVSSSSGSINLYCDQNGTLNTTDSNYYFQYIDAYSSNVVGYRATSPFLLFTSDGQRSIGITKIKLTNNGYFVYQNQEEYSYATSSPSIRNTNATSTFTTNSITKLRIHNGSNAIGAGSRFQLYKRVAPIVFDYTVSGSAVTQIDITGLNIDKTGEYQLVSTLVNGTGTGSYHYAYFNGNTTDTNYYSQNLDANGTSVGASRVNNSDFAWTQNSPYNYTFSISDIKLTNNGYGSIQHNTAHYFGNTGIKIRKVYSTSTFTASSLTSLSIKAGTSGAIGIGSRFQLIKLK